MLGCLKITYDVLNWITLNCTMHSQTNACTAKSSCAFSSLLRCYAALSVNYLPTFRTAYQSYLHGPIKPKETS